MSEYFFLSNHPKFGAVLKPNDTSVAQKKGPHPYLVIESAKSKKSRKGPISSIVANTCSVGRDSTKKAKSMDFVVASSEVYGSKHPAS